MQVEAETAGPAAAEEMAEQAQEQVREGRAALAEPALRQQMVQSRMLVV